MQQTRVRRHPSLYSSLNSFLFCLTTPQSGWLWLSVMRSAGHVWLEVGTVEAGGRVFA